MPSAKAGWKSGEQLEYLLTEEANFKRAQDAKALDPFWSRVFEEWHHRWVLPDPSPALCLKWKTPDALRDAVKKARNKVGDNRPLPPAIPLPY